MHPRLCGWRSTATPLTHSSDRRAAPAPRVLAPIGHRSRAVITFARRLYLLGISSCKFLAPPISKHKNLFNLDRHVVVVSSRNFHFDQHADRQCKGSKAEATWWQQAAARIVVHVWTDRAFEQQGMMTVSLLLCFFSPAETNPLMMAASSPLIYYVLDPPYIRLAPTCMLSLESYQMLGLAMISVESRILVRVV